MPQVSPQRRAVGIGTVLTTNHLRCEAELKAALGIRDDVATYALMPIGWPPIASC